MIKHIERSSFSRNYMLTYPGATLPCSVPFGVSLRRLEHPNSLLSFMSRLSDHAHRLLVSLSVRLPES